MSKILLVEDNPIYSDAAKRYLASVNVEVQHAQDYSNAVHLLRESDYDAVITDVFFPVSEDAKGVTAGYMAIDMMKPTEKRDPVMRAIAKLQRVAGAAAAEQLVDSRGPYIKTDYVWDMEQAMLKDPVNQALGVLVADEAEKMGKPVVLATSTYHHDNLTQLVQNYAGERGWTLVDCPKKEPDQKFTQKFWQRVHRTIEDKL